MQDTLAYIVGTPTGRDDMNRDELLTKLAMELEEWPSAGKLHAHIGDIKGFDGARFVGEKLFARGPMHRNGMVIFQRHSWLQRRTELINRPSWDDAPEWAQWRAQDSSGEFCWHQSEPVAHDRQWDSSGQVAPSNIGKIPAGHNWRDTLEPRPQAKPQTCRHCDITFQRPHVDGIPGDRCTRCDDEIKALWPERGPATTHWTSKTCTECGRTIPAKVSDDAPVCLRCVAPGPDISDEGPDISDPVNHPAHYQSDSGIECIDAIRAALGRDQYEGYMRGACIKYLWRYNIKGGVESLRKAQWYLNRLIDHHEETEPKDRP